MRKTCIFLMIPLIFILSACFSSRQSLSVIGYRNARVYIKKDLSYQVGTLSQGWREFDTKAKAVVFRNAELGATISTDAFCGASFEDLPLKTLSGQLFAGFSSRTILSDKEFLLDGRGAMRTISKGSLDGVAMKFDSVVVKKNNCTIDFVYISHPENYEQGVKDFESFFGGFGF